MTSFRWYDGLTRRPSTTDPSVPQLYSAATKSALDGGKAELAVALADAGVTIAPNDANLLDLQARAKRDCSDSPT